LGAARPRQCPERVLSIVIQPDRDRPFHESTVSQL
jgi:hypothetical protein